MSKALDDQIASLRVFSDSLTREDAILFLKGNDYDLDRAAGALLDNVDPRTYESKVNYDENAWSADRNSGQTAGPSIPSYQISNPDESTGIYALGAPSRPPSRTQNGQESGQVPMDWTHDSDMEKAKQMSMHEAYRQGTGNYFSQYGREVIPDLDAPSRRRESGTPAFIKPMMIKDFLPSFITILQTIPQCRQAFISPDQVLDDYGQNAHWWSGDPITSASINYNGVVDEDAPDTTKSAPTPMQQEMQRLMAFLELTERSYGSVEALGRLQSISGLYEDAMGLIAAFMEAWDSVVSGSNLFATTSKAVDSEYSRKSWLFDLSRDNVFGLTDSMDLTRALDAFMWGKLTKDVTPAEGGLEKLAPVLVIQLPKHEGNKINVFPELYLDRYLFSNAKRMKQVLEETGKYQDEVDDIRRQLDKLQNFYPDQRSAVPGSTQELFEKTLAHLRSRAGDKDAKEESVRDGTLVTQLEAIHKKIQLRVDALKEEQAKALNALGELSEILAAPSDDPEKNPTRRYHLRGVATMATAIRTDVTYIPKNGRATESLIDVVPEGPSQWWKMAYDVTGGYPKVSKQLISQDEVLTAAGKGDGRALLVFAADDMLSHENITPLPPPLKTFVEADNTAFKSELDSTTIEGVPIPRHRSRRDSDSSMQVHQDDHTEDRSWSDNAPHFDQQMYAPPPGPPPGYNAATAKRVPPPSEASAREAEMHERGRTTTSDGAAEPEPAKASTGDAQLIDTSVGDDSTPAK